MGKEQKICIQIFFIPAGLLFIAYYFAVIFYLQDLPVIFGILAVTALIMMILSLANPNLKKGKSGRMAILGLPAIILVASMFVSNLLVENYRTSLFEQTEAKRVQEIKALSKTIPASGQ